MHVMPVQAVPPPDIALDIQLKPEVAFAIHHILDSTLPRAKPGLQLKASNHGRWLYMSGATPRARMRRIHFSASVKQSFYQPAQPRHSTLLSFAITP